MEKRTKVMNNVLRFFWVLLSLGMGTTISGLINEELGLSGTEAMLIGIAATLVSSAVLYVVYIVILFMKKKLVNHISKLQKMNKQQKIVWTVYLFFLTLLFIFSMGGDEYYFLSFLYFGWIPFLIAHFMWKENK